MDGIIRSAMLTPTQRGDIDGLVKSGLPEHARRHSGHHSVGGKGGVEVMRVKPSATRRDIGSRHYPGSHFA